MNPYLLSQPASQGRAGIVNGILAEAGDADATGMLLSDDKIGGSAVLISANAVLTTHHAIRDDFSDYYFFLPGVGKRMFKQCSMSIPAPEGPDHGCQRVAPDGVAKDLAILFLEEPILSVKPVDLAVEEWAHGTERKARVSGFGHNSSNSLDVTRKGLRQYSDVSVKLDQDIIRFTSEDSQLAAADSGGPIIDRENQQLIGLAVQKETSTEPSRGIPLSEESLDWIKTAIGPSTNEGREFRTLVCAVSRGDRSNPITQEDIINIRRLEHGERLVVTANAQRESGRKIKIELRQNGGSASLDEDFGFRCQLKEIAGPTDTDLSVYYSAPEGPALGQIVYTIDSEVADA